MSVTGKTKLQILMALTAFVSSVVRSELQFHKYLISGEYVFAIWFVHYIALWFLIIFSQAAVNYLGPHIIGGDGKFNEITDYQVRFMVTVTTKRLAVLLYSSVRSARRKPRRDIVARFLLLMPMSSQT